MGSTVPAKRSGARASTSKVRGVRRALRSSSAVPSAAAAIHSRRAPAPGRGPPGLAPRLAGLRRRRRRRATPCKPPSSTATSSCPSQRSSHHSARGERAVGLVVGDDLGVVADAERAEARGEGLRRSGSGWRPLAARDGRGQVAIQIGIARAGNVAAQIGRPAGVRRREIEAAVDDREAPPASPSSRSQRRRR